MSAFAYVAMSFASRLQIPSYLLRHVDNSEIKQPGKACDFARVVMLALWLFGCVCSDKRVRVDIGGYVPVPLSVEIQRAAR